MPNTDSVKFLRQDMAKIIDKARELGIMLKNRGVDMNQLRNFYEDVVELDLQLQDERRNHSGAKITDNPVLVDKAKLLPTKLVWAAARADRPDKREALSDFYKEINGAIDGLFDAADNLEFDQYVRFRQFAEAIVVYHKAQASGVFNR